MIAEIFSTSFLFSIAIIIILVGGLFAYFNHRFSEQNHKMQSMLGLVSTMAEEMQYFRSKLTSRPDEHNRMPDADIIQFIPNFFGGNGNGRVEKTDLIEVSDSESVDEEDDEYESECESECDSVASLEIDDDDDDDDDDDSIDSECESIEEVEAERKIISIDLGINNEFVIDSEDINLNEEINEDTNEETTGEIKSVNLEDIDMSLKSISIDGFSDVSFSNNKGKGEYKKLSLNKLREVVVEKGLVIDSSKLKKNELLKMLGEE
jgi:hypothetical protein